MPRCRMCSSDFATVGVEMPIFSAAAGIDKIGVDALLSRVRHYCHTVTINGPSLRDPQG